MSAQNPKEIAAAAVQAIFNDKVDALRRAMDGSHGALADAALQAFQVVLLELWNGKKCPRWLKWLERMQAGAPKQIHEGEVA